MVRYCEVESCVVGGSSVGEDRRSVMNCGGYYGCSVVEGFVNCDSSVGESWVSERFYC